MNKLIVILILIVLISSCEIELGEPPCFDGYKIEWDIKKKPIVKQPIINILDYYEVIVLLYDDYGVSDHMENFVVKKDTIILNAVNIDLTNYQNDIQKCEIFLRYTE